MIYINPYLSVPINTIIGGVAGTISTKSALATKLGISESIIKRFEIVGSNVHARITSNYSLGVNIFQNDTSINSFLDLDGYCQGLGTNTFTGSSVVNLYIPNATLANSSVGGGSGGSLVTNSLYNGDYVYNKSFVSGTGSMRYTKIKRFISPNVNTAVGNYFIANNTELTEFGGNPTDISNNAFQNNSKLMVLNLEYVIGIGQFGLDGCSSLPSVNGLAIINLSPYALRNLSSATFINLPVLVNIDNKLQVFRGLSSCNLISMKKLKKLGTASEISDCFLGLKVGCTIEVNITLATANSGAADAALVWAKTNRSAIVNFYDDAGNYVSTL